MIGMIDKMKKLRNMVESDLYRVNSLLVDAFTKGRVEDGYRITYIPLPKIEFLQMYYRDGGDSSFVIEEQGRIVAASFTHVWGRTGWIGPLAVASSRHDHGLGAEITRHSIEFLKESGCTAIGLETNPRSYKNLGFYGKLGFVSQFLTVDMIRQIFSPRFAKTDLTVKNYSALSSVEKQKFLRRIKYMTEKYADGLDYSPLILNTNRFHFGDTFLFLRNAELVAFAVVHTQSVSEEERQNVAKIVAFAFMRDLLPYFKDLLHLIEEIVKSDFYEDLVIRVPLVYHQVFRLLLEDGFRIINSDIRMTLEGYEEKRNRDFINLSRWS